jgi:hypothetical protein
MAQRQFRYRTTALTGPWRGSFDQAVEDAARAGQILFDQDKQSDFRWVVPGQIEQKGGAEARVSRRL